MRFLRVTKKIGGILMLTFLIFSAFCDFAYATTPTPTPCPDGKYCSLTTIPGAFDVDAPADPIKVVKNIYGISIGIGAMLAVIMIIWAGVEYATTESIYGHSDAKERWQGALFGLLLLVSSYIILRTINIQLVDINLDLGKPLVGELVDPLALQKSLDILNKTAKEIQENKTAGTDLEKQRLIKQDRLDKLIGEGKEDTDEAQKLEGEINSIRTEIMRLEEANKDLKTLSDTSKEQLLKLTQNSLTCYTVSKLNKQPEFCFNTVKECNEARAVDSPTTRSGTKTACETKSPEQSKDKFEYCTNVKVTQVYTVGINKKNVLSINKPICNSSPAGCQSDRIKIEAYSKTLKPGMDGFVEQIGACTQQVKVAS